MTLTLYRSRWQVYHGEYPAVDTYEWSFAPLEPTLTFGRVAGCLMSREPDGEVVIVTPALARMIEVGERRSARLAFHGEDGLDAEAVASLAAQGERGFKVSEDDAMAKKKVEQPALFAGFHEEPDRPTGAYGRRPAGEDRVTPVVEALKEHQDASRAPWEPHDVGVEEMPAKVKAVVEELCTMPRDMVLAELEAQARGGRPSVSAVTDDGKLVASITGKPSSPPKQAAIDAAGIDVVADIDWALKYIREGSGITAIRILERTREALAKGRGNG